MPRYIVERLQERTQLYFLIRDTEDDSIVRLPTRYLMFRIRSKISPNTVKMQATALKYYLNYLDETAMTLPEVLSLSYDRQFLHFTDYLEYLSKRRDGSKHRKNRTCNQYLKHVFAWICFLESTSEIDPGLKILRNRMYVAFNSVGVCTYHTYRTFPGFLKVERSKGRSMPKDKIPDLLTACTNIRDTLLILLLSETGFRIGEILGIRYTEDLDLERHVIFVAYREDNENLVRAKNAEIRQALISDRTFEILMIYMARYRDLIAGGEYLFVTLTGKKKGLPLKPGTVYAMLREITKKTGISATPHMLRHYFANERRKNGWDILLISRALGHRHLSTTEQYLDVESDELAQASEAYFEKYSGMVDPTALL